MYMIKRTRQEGMHHHGSDILQNDGNLYYVFLVRMNRFSHVGIVAQPFDITIEDVSECVTVGPLPLNACHRFGLTLVTGVRGFPATRSKLDYIANELGLTPRVSHWEDPTMINLGIEAMTLQ